MEYSVNQGNQSNYEIVLKVPQDDMEAYKKKALQSFQKEMKEPGFRPGHVPLDIVEKKIQPQYLEIAIYEEVLHEGTKKILDEHKDIKFIGNMYDLNREEKNSVIHFTFKLDVYPEVNVENKKWEKLSVKAVDATPTQDEVDETLMNLKKQYADYQPADTVSEGNVFKVTCTYLDKNDEEIEKKAAFFGQEEWDEHKSVKELFEGKKVNEEVKIDYNEKTLPPQLFNKSEDKKPASIICVVQDIREVKLPEFTPETIKKLFGNEDVKDEKELVEKIKDLISNQKEEAQLMQAVDEMLIKAKESLTITIPKTLVDEEVKTRMKSLEERMGGQKGLDDYFKKIGDEQREKMVNDITNAAKTSLEKFFILQKLTELLEIKDIDWNTSLDVEKKVYETLKK